MCDSELISPSTSIVGLPYLVSRPEDREAARALQVPTAANSTHRYRCWRDLQRHHSRGVDLFFTSIQRSIRASRRGQPSYLARVWE